MCSYPDIRWREKPGDLISDFGEIAIPNEDKNMPDNERQIQSQMKLGAGLALLGLVCPFFWMSLLSGNSWSETWVYGMHSGFFIVIGLALLGKGWHDRNHVVQK